MVKIIVAVLTVAAHTVEVGDLVQIAAQAVNLVVGVEICGICFFDTPIPAKSSSDMDHISSPSLQKYSRPTQTVCSISATM